MPELEEELASLKGALSLLQSRHISDIKQLGEQIDALQRQIDEQKKRVSEHGQSINQRFDGLESVLSQQFALINQNFAGLNQNFFTINQNFLRLEQQGKQQFSEIKTKFEVSDHFAARTWGVVQEQERDIREIKGYLGTIDNKIDQVLARLPQQEE